MNWFDILKDIPSHTTFISGPKPKVKFDTKPLEDILVRHIMGRMRKFNPKNWKSMIAEGKQSVVNTGRMLTGGVAKDFFNEVVLPRLEADENLELKDAWTWMEWIKYSTKVTYPQLFLEEEK